MLSSPLVRVRSRVQFSPAAPVKTLKNQRISSVLTQHICALSRFVELERIMNRFCLLGEIWGKDF